jgi:hypothetical protein
MDVNSHDFQGRSVSWNDEMIVPFMDRKTVITVPLDSIGEIHVLYEQAFGRAGSLLNL